MVLRRNTKDLRRVSKFEEALEEFLKEKDLPQWYRAYSSFQLKAADDLMTSIRDDIAQETTHRVRNCLTVLGLMPLLPNKCLKLIMGLSGGNDLAFLWFLMEYHYKTSNDNEYSLNEQLILSGIAHLDMITTLRGLDTLLPTGHKSKRTLSRFRAVIRENIVSRKRSQNEQKTKLMPYFKKLERPKQIKPTSMIVRPDFKVDFRLYDKYKDPNYEPPNERNRWFTTYAFHESLRVSLAEMHLYCDNLFENMKLPNVGEKTAMYAIDTALENMENSRAKKSFCLHHQREFEELQSKKLSQELAKKEKCLKSLELFKKQKKERLARINQALEKEVNTYRIKYRAKSKDGNKDHKKYLQLMGDNNLSEYSLRDEYAQEQTICTTEQREAEVHSADATSADRMQRTTKKQQHGGGSIRKVKSVTSFSAIKTSASILSMADKQYIENYNYGHESMPSPATSQIFFQSPTANEPYKFNYAKIFHYEQFSNTEKFIKEAFVSAIENKGRRTPRQFPQMPNVGDAARKFADKNWDHQLSNFRILYHDTRKAIGLQSVENMEAQQNSLTNDNLPPDMPRLEFYDCEDKELMHNMLQIALNHLAKNPKYVLASLPDCHKIPILREWIYQRYGKTYTQAERVADFAHSKRLLQGLNTIKFGASIPKSKDISPIMEHSYKCHRHIIEKVQRVRNAYFRQAGKAYMDNTRLMWFAMNNALCSVSQRQMFFAYMPQRFKDLHHIGPWKLHQKKDMAMIWERKRLQKMQAAVLKF